MSVKQGSFPDQDLYTDFRVYDQILFQVLKNSLVNICEKGAISIAVLFTKEQKRTWVSNKHKTEEVTTDVGKIVTVFKYTKQKESESPIRIKTHAEEH